MRKIPIINIALALALVSLQGRALSAPPVPNASTSAAPVMNESEKEDFEKQVATELKEWEQKVKNLRADLKKSHEFEEHHRHLKRAARHLESDIKDVKHQLSKFKGASPKNMKHYEDHIKAEFDDMKTTYNKVASE
jgi:septal ring factor EnvC (AmiA/AmiB activator)